MNTVKELRRGVEDVTDDLLAQYGRDTPMCEILHRELSLPQTLRDDAGEFREKLLANAEKIGADAEIEENSIKLTIEHTDLHDALRRMVVDSMSQGMDATQMAAQMYAVGRRQGLREAAELLGD